jgi:Phage tail lysozyme
LTSGSRRSGRSKFGPFKRVFSGHQAEIDHGAPEGHDLPYTGRHAGPRGKTARKRAGKAVPAAAAAATLAAGAAAYLLVGGNAPHAAQLSDAMSAGVGSVASPAVASPSVTATSSAGGGSVLVKVAKAHAIQPQTAKAAATAKPAVRPSAKPSATAAHAEAAAAPAATKSASPSATPSSSTSQSSRSLSCDLSGGLLPANVSAIVSFLLANGYSDNAAAGIAGNMYQESKGNPESEGMGGGGLIGWTPLPSGFVTGDVSADLETQLNALLTYNQGWSQYLSELNGASSPASAAYIYVTEFERAGIPAASTREAAASDVAAACGI